MDMEGQEGVWKVPGSFLERDLTVSGSSLELIWKISGKYESSCKFGGFGNLFCQTPHQTCESY